MIRTCCLVLALSATTASVAEETAPLAVESHIQSVMVYPDRAEVTRTVDVTLEPGRNVIAIGGLPLSLDDESLRCTVEGARVVDFQTERYRSQRNLRQELAELDVAHADLSQRITEQEDTIVALRRRGNLLSDYRGQVLERIRSDLRSAEPPLEAWRKALAFVAEHAHAGQAAVREAEVIVYELRRDAEANRARVAHLNATDDRPESRRMQLWIDATDTGKHTVTIRYLVTADVRWGMRYDLRLNREQDELELTALVAVSQNSDEDWTNAAVSFSTRQPARGLQPPSLEPLRLAAGAPASVSEVSLGGGDLPVVAVSPQHQRSQQSTTQTVQVTRPDDLVGGGELVDPGSLQIRAVQGMTDELIYHGAEPVDINADGRPVVVPLGTWRTPAAWRMECIPEVLAAVYVRADFANPSGARLLPGPAEVYLDGRSIGPMEFPGCPADGTAAAAFGIAQDLVVEREMQPVEELRSTSDQPASADAHTWRYAMTTRIRNLGNRAETVTIHETIPVSDLEHVSVALDDSTTAGGTVQDGRIMWTLPVASADAAVIELAFTITTSESESAQ